MIRRLGVVALTTARRERSRGASTSHDGYFGLGAFATGVALFVGSPLAHSLPAAAATEDAQSLVVNRERVDELRGRLCDLLANANNVGEHALEARWLDDEATGFTLHRFLVSRNHDMDAAEAMFRSTVAWRCQHKVRAELAAWRRAGGGGGSDGAAGPRSREQRERLLADTYGYAARSGSTEDGVPLNVERVGQYDIAGCVAVPGMTDLVAKAYIMYLEETFQAVREASVRKGSYVRCRVVTDARGVGLGHVKHSRLMREVVALGQKNYPELIQSVLVVRAPLSMHTLWNYGVRWMLPARVQGKVQICGEAFDDRLAALAISRKALPAFLGGERRGTVGCGAATVPLAKGAIQVPAVSLFGRLAQSKSAEAKTKAASLRDGIKGVLGWATSSAD